MPIFISYRREETADIAGRIYDHLRARYGDSEVFFDIDKIGPGTDFLETIIKYIDRSDTFVTIVGKRYFSRRIKEPEDYVRLEIEAAIEQKKHIVPVLVGGARMPKRRKLPPSISAIARRQAATVNSGREFPASMHYLIEGIENLRKLSASGQSDDVTQRSGPGMIIPETREMQVIRADATTVVHDKRRLDKRRLEVAEIVRWLRRQRRTIALAGVSLVVAFVAARIVLSGSGGAQKVVAPPPMVYRQPNVERRVPAPQPAPLREVQVRSVPAGADVYLQGTIEALGRTDFSWRFDPKQTASPVLVFHKEGFVSQTRAVDGNEVLVELAPVPPEVEPPPAAPATTDQPIARVAKSARGSRPKATKAPVRPPAKRLLALEHPTILISPVRERELIRPVTVVVEQFTGSASASVFRQIVLRALSLTGAKVVSDVRLAAIAADLGLSNVSQHYEQVAREAGAVAFIAGSVSATPARITARLVFRAANGKAMGGQVWQAPSASGLEGSLQGRLVSVLTQGLNQVLDPPRLPSPSIGHLPKQSASPPFEDGILIMAQVEGLGSGKVVLDYRPEGASLFRSLDMWFEPPGALAARIPEDALVGRSSVAYYIEARGPEGQALARNGTPDKPHVIKLEKTLSSQRAR